MSGPSNVPGGKGIGGRLVKSPWASFGRITEGGFTPRPATIRSGLASPSTATSVHLKWKTWSDASSAGRVDEILVKEVPPLFSRNYGPIRLVSEPELPTYISR